MTSREIHAYVELPLARGRFNLGESIVLLLLGSKLFLVMRVVWHLRISERLFAAETVWASSIYSKLGLRFTFFTIGKFWRWC